MLFNTLDYAIFFGIVFAISWALVVRRKLRLTFLLLASYVFYAWWDWHYVPLIWGSSTLDWWLGRRIGREQEPRRRKRWLLVTVIVNLGVLGVFKYANFGIDTARALAESFGFHPSEVALRIALPIGISFFTFESMSYVIDVYRRELPAHESYLEYLSFVAFFPHLVAGPIVRPRDLLPQLSKQARWSPTEGSEALFLIAMGLLKKVAISDYLVDFIDRVFDAPFQYSALECYAAVLGFATRIYCDFSGYTDIAIGSALLLGVRMPTNFQSPYQAHDIQSFWRRWHISLSTWLRDYLYVPLGGNRKGELRTYLNLIVTMLLGGLWHGASWTFVVWGGLHGAALAVNRWWSRRRATSDDDALAPLASVADAPALRRRSALLAVGVTAAAALLYVRLGTLDGLVPQAVVGAIGRLPRVLVGGILLASVWAFASTYAPVERDGAWRTRLGRLLPTFVTFHFVCVCWVFFRARTFGQARLMFSQLATLTTFHPNLAWQVLAVLAVGLGLHFTPGRLYVGLQEGFARLPAPLQGVLLFAVAVTLRQMASAGAVPFVYFQF